MIRIFTDSEGGAIEITNKHFALIEKSDAVYTVYDEDYNDNGHPVALVILTGCGDYERLEGIIFDDEYFSKKIKERE